jgi:hypothetical protein
MATSLLIWDLEKLKHLTFVVTLSATVLGDSKVYSNGGWVTTNTKILTE